jgi:NAD(P)-dependent dehydrogenase (short-subunit alcohol dehydrogenase family)
MSLFTGRIAVVAGGGSGIGSATVERLLSEGARVAVLDLDASAWHGRDGCLALTVDVRDETSVQGAIDGVLAEWGRIDVLVNSVGLELVAGVLDTTVEQWDRVVNTNIRGFFLTTKAALPHLQLTRGTIVNVASQLALVGAKHFSAYTASKAAVLGFTRSVALEVAADGVRVNAVCPGAVDTPLLQRQFAGGRQGPQGTLDDLISMHPLGRLGRPDEIARAIVFLASEESSFMTGSTMVVDGGYTA